MGATSKLFALFFIEFVLLRSGARLIAKESALHYAQLFSLKQMLLWLILHCASLYFGIGGPRKRH